MAMQHQSKFRQGRGQRAQANKLTAKPSMEREEQLEEKVAPGIHEQVESMEGEDGADHGPAHEVHVMHDHAAGRHHVHSVHPDGFEHHSDHPTPHHAHHHAAKMAGVNLPAPEQEEHAEPGDEEEYAEPLD